ncbi:MAG: MerR family transcriptional regulator [Actinomycetota bacterium]
MLTYSSRQVAQKLGISIATLSNYISHGKIPEPKSLTTGGITVHIWTDADVERVRKLLPKIKNGRKTRYQKLRKKQKAQPRAAVPRTKKSTKKKK